MREIEQGLDLQPNEPGLLELQGVLKTEAGRPGDGLVDLDQADRGDPILSPSCTRPQH